MDVDDGEPYSGNHLACRRLWILSMKSVCLHFKDYSGARGRQASRCSAVCFAVKFKKTRNRSVAFYTKDQSYGRPEIRTDWNGRRIRVMSRSLTFTRSFVRTFKSNDHVDEVNFQFVIRPSTALIEYTIKQWCSEKYLSEPSVRRESFLSTSRLRGWG